MESRTALPALVLAIVLLPLTPLEARATPPSWRWPLDGHPRVLRHFAPPAEPWLAGHRGIDLAAPASTPVLAAGPGKVGFAGRVAGTGVVTVDHGDGLRTTYLPVAASVKPGRPVASGALLGVIERSGDHCEESCLHWGLLREARYLNPLLLLGHAPIRLLPFWSAGTAAVTPPSPPQKAAAPASGQRTSAEAASATGAAMAVPSTRTAASTALIASHQPPSTASPSPLNGYLASGSTSLSRRPSPGPSPSASAAPPAGLALAVLGTLLLIIAVRRRHRRQPPARRSAPGPRRGQHRKQRGRRTAGRSGRRRSAPSPPLR